MSGKTSPWWALVLQQMGDTDSGVVYCRICADHISVSPTYSTSNVKKHMERLHSDSSLVKLVGRISKGENQPTIGAVRPLTEKERDDMLVDVMTMDGRPFSSLDNGTALGAMLQRSGRVCEARREESHE